MSGETERDPSAWTIDSVLALFRSIVEQMELRANDKIDAHQKEHLLQADAQQIAVELNAKCTADELTAVKEFILESDRRYQQRFEAQEKALEVALTAHEASVANLRSFYNTILEERDMRYDQRYEATMKAQDVALGNAVTQFEQRVAQVRQESVTALAAAEKAIDKAEAATEKRFSSVNEFRAQQADMISTFARKSELDTRLAGLVDKVDSVYEQAIHMASTTLPRNEYDRAHVDLAERVIQVEKALNEKIEAQAKTFDQRIMQMQSQVTSIEAVTR